MNALNHHVLLWISCFLLGPTNFAQAQTLKLDVANKPQVKLVFCCSEENDLYKVVSNAGREYERYDRASSAIDNAPAGAGVLILADGYPKETTKIEDDTFERASKKNLRLFIEYPASLPGIRVGPPRETKVERAVIASDFFGSNLKKSSIVSVNGLRYVPIEAENAHMVAARVAGFDNAVYGLPKETSPLLFEMPSQNVLVSTTKLSHFVTGRYAPQESWRSIWSAILSWLNPDTKRLSTDWTPTVDPMYGRDDRLPVDYEKIALERGIDWFKKSNMIVHSSFQKQIVGKDRCEPPAKGTPVGDGTLGSLEAVISVIRQDGSQPLSSAQRGDCISETSMALAFAGKVLNNKNDSIVASNLLDYYLFESDAQKKERGDPNHGAYGLIAWGITTPAWYRANYGDDNARQILSVLATAALNDDDRWDESMMMCLLANLRTTGQLGFRGGRIDIRALNGGWEQYFHRKNVNIHPHYECYLWACYLWAYEQTGDALFLNRAESALRLTMSKYTDGWKWTNGLAQERARILLPLAWLVRVKDTKENRAMLRTAAEGLIALQDDCGAIREELGKPGMGQFPPPQNNAAYGTSEASLIAKNGDPVADLLYTSNFAFLGLHEAAAVTGDKDIIEAENKLAEFLCRIQVKSKVHPQLDGGWFRAFDFGRWEHWGCNADHGWGAWAIESGWTQAWITSVLAMRQINTSLWELTQNSNIERHHKRLREQMIPADSLKSLEERAAAKAKSKNHSGIKKDVRLNIDASPSYPGLGARSLLDGKIGSTIHDSGLWLGFHGTDLEATIDMGKPVRIRYVVVRCLQSDRLGIYLPKKVVLEKSKNGKTFVPASTIDVQPMKPGQANRVHTVLNKETIGEARYLRVRAINIAKIPKGHHAAGKKAWLFVDEILINPDFVIERID